MNYGMDFQGGDTGGGFTANTNSFGDAQSSQQGRPRRSYDEQTLIPVSIRMAVSAGPDPSGGDGSLLLEDGRKIASVKVVGAVRSVNDHSTNVVYEVEDGTGLLEVKQWHDDNDCTAIHELRQSTLKEHIYIKAIGQIKDYEGKKLLVANSVRPLSTGDELTHHFLEVMHSAEKYKRADSIVSAPPVGTGVGFGGPSVEQRDTVGTGDSLKDKLQGYIESMDEGSEAGVSIQALVQRLGNAHTEADVRRAVESLSEEGVVYSTINDDHYKSAKTD